MTFNSQERPVPKPVHNPKGAGRKPFKNPLEKKVQQWTSIEVADSVDATRHAKKFKLTLSDYLAIALHNQMVHDGVKEGDILHLQVLQEL